jgi:hypothetical protein
VIFILQKINKMANAKMVNTHARRGYGPDGGGGGEGWGQFELAAASPKYKRVLWGVLTKKMATNGCRKRYLRGLKQMRGST